MSNQFKGSYFNILDKSIFLKRFKEDSFPFPQNLMWDYPLENIDLEKHKMYVIERVATRGNIYDFLVLLSIYSKEEIVDALYRSKDFTVNAASFCEAFFNLPHKSLPLSTFYGID